MNVGDTVAFEIENCKHEGVISAFEKRGRWDYAVVGQYHIRPTKLRVLAPKSKRPSRHPTMAPPRSTKRPPPTKSVIDKHYKKVHLPDERFTEMTLDDLYNEAQKNSDLDLRSRYASLNIGMQRMNLTNRLRGKK